MRKWLIILFLLLTQVSEGQPLYEHRGVQYATHGTDFWFCMPRTLMGNTRNCACIYIMAEHDCTVTIRNDILDYTYTKQITNCHTINTRLDTLNFIELPWEFVCFADTLITGAPADRQIAALPQIKGFHITSTDTICVFVFPFSRSKFDVTNLLPTEMLRDEYVVQMVSDNVEKKGMFEIVATEDSTVVDITLGGRDWMGRPKDSVVTVMLNRGMIFHDMVCINDCENDSSMSGLSGTYIKARDNKRIAVFQGNQRFGIDHLFEQAMPIRYAGTEFLVPRVHAEYVQFTGLVDGTAITVMDPSDPSLPTTTLTIDALQSKWHAVAANEGPVYITSTHPILTSLYSLGGRVGGTTVVVPIEWWHNGPINSSEVYWVDDNNNGWSHHHYVHLFTRTADVGGMYFNRYPIDTMFHPVAGTPYSYAVVVGDVTSLMSRRVAQSIENRLGGAFWVVSEAEDLDLSVAELALYNYSHLQHGSNYLEVNDIPADSLPQDSIWCMYDPIRFHGWVERPADSIIWDFGDGNEERYRYEDGQWVTHTYTDTGRFEVKRIIQYMDEALDTIWGYVGCKSAFTRPSDTMYAHIWIHNHYDSAFAVTVCEGPFTFRGHVLETTDTHYVTTYWTASGCDTLWQIDLVTCPHCSFYSDTISDEQLPWFFNGISFSSETRHYPIHIDIDDECDSIIDYYLIVIPHWGEPPLDTVFILAPNVVMPNSDIEANRTFRLFCSKDVEVADVYVFDRVGRRLAHFDGLTEEWDCTYNGIPCPQAAYAYYVRYIDGSNRNWKTASGTFTIIR